MNELEKPVMYVKGVGPQRADMLKTELGIHQVGDLLMHFPFRYVDKTTFFEIGSLHPESGTVQIKGILRRLDTVATGRRKRLVGRLRDATGSIELVWFTGAHYLEKQLDVGKEYVVYGRINSYGSKLSIAHPEMEPLDDKNK